MSATQNDGFTQTTAVGGETIIDFDFLIYEKTDIAFYETDLSNVITLLALNTDYSIADSELEDSGGGDIVLLSGPYPTGATAGHKFTAISDIAETRSGDFQQGGDFFATSINRSLDRLTRLAQQLRRDVDKKLGLRLDSTQASIGFVDSPQDGYALVWDADGNVRNSDFSLATLEGNASIVAQNIDAINDVADEITAVSAVGDNIASVIIVANDIASVITVADNIQEILDALNNSTNMVTAAAVIDNNAIVMGAGGARGVDANATGNRVTKGWFTDVESTNAPTVNGTGTLVNSDPTSVTGADKVSNVLSLTQAEYNAITPNGTTLYYITDA